jgi:hypothetical protein
MIVKKTKQMEKQSTLFDGIIDDVNISCNGSKSRYSRLVSGICYEPGGVKPGIIELCDTREYTRLVMQIKRARDENKIDNNEFNFLMLAATRFLEFNFQKIADYYANESNTHMKELMEELCLVILDLDARILSRYASFVNDIKKIIE